MNRRGILGKIRNFYTVRKFLHVISEKGSRFVIFNFTVFSIQVIIIYIPEKPSFFIFIKNLKYFFFRTSKNVETYKQNIFIIQLEVTRSNTIGNITKHHATISFS